MKQVKALTAERDQAKQAVTDTNKLLREKRKELLDSELAQRAAESTATRARQSRDQANADRDEAQVAYSDYKETHTVGNTVVVWTVLVLVLVAVIGWIA